MTERFAVTIVGPKRRSVVRIFLTMGEAETFRQNVARNHPDLNTFTSVIVDQDGIGFVVGG